MIWLGFSRLFSSLGGRARVGRLWMGDRWSRTGEDEINACGLEPVSVFVEVGVDAGGADDGVGGFEGNVFVVFEHAFEDAAEFAAPPGEEAGAMGVAVDRGAIGEFVFSGYQLWAAPADEVAFDCVAFGMLADGAAAGVAGEIGGSSRGNGGSQGSGGCRRG